MMRKAWLKEYITVCKKSTTLIKRSFVTDLNRIKSFDGIFYNLTFAMIKHKLVFITQF